MNFNYLFTGDNLTVFFNGEERTIAEQSMGFNEAVNACLVGNLAEAWNLASPIEAIKSYSDNLINIEDGVLKYESNGYVYNFENVVVDKLLELFRAKKPFKHLENFILKLMENPSQHAHNGLYEFLDREGMPIGSDGCFYGYKSVTPDEKDYHTRTVCNKDGATPWMPRSAVSDDRNSHCSQGYHVGGWVYVSSFGGHDKVIKLVKVDPRNVVCIPNDHNCEKARVNTYEVIRTVTEPVTANDVD